MKSLKSRLSLLLIGYIALNLLIISYFSHHSLAQASPSPENLKPFSQSDLARYDGTSPSLPILLSFEGNVYDVTAGRQYYGPGGPYHFLAGTDQTELLHQLGGAIIQKKYPVVGRLTAQ